ncbi:MAG: tetratricopeptide repeat protein [Gammaproteobacteria bacterium]
MTTSAASILSLSLWAWLWPSDFIKQEPEGTLKDLDARELQVEFDDEHVAGGLDEALAAYRAYLKLPTDDASMRAEATRRLADLNLKAGDNEQVERGQTALGAAHNRDAIVLYRQLLSDFPDYAQRDHVLYQLARAREIEGQLELALQTLDQLVAAYPRSELLDEAQFRRGELLFLQKDYIGSEEAYAVVVKLGSGSQFYEQSLYKQGWSLFKQADYDASVNTFMDLLDWRIAFEEEASLRAGMRGIARAERELLEDAMRIVSLSVSYLDGPASLRRYVKRRGMPVYSFMLYERLGALYLEKERFLDAADTFEGFVALEPMHSQAPQMQGYAMEAYRKGRFPSLVLSSKETFVNTYGLNSKYWRNHNPAERPDVIKPLKTNLSDLASFHHEQAQAEGDAAQYELAAGWYRRYLEYFPDDPDSAQRSFLLAEILMETGDYMEANHFFRRAAYSYPGYADAGKAGFASILASREYLASLSRRKGQDWYEQQLHQSLEFSRSFPAHPQSNPVLSKQAEELFAAQRYEEAAIVGGLVLTREPAVVEDLQRVAWTVVAHSQFDLQRYARAEKAYIKLRIYAARGEEVPSDLDERIAASVYRQAEQAQGENDSAAAIAHYLRVAQVAPGTSIHPNATYDAAALLLQTEQWNEGAEVLRQFRTQFPQHKFNDDVTQKLAVAYMQAGRRGAAAVEFERVAALDSVEPGLRREALWQAAELYQQNEAFAQSSAAFARYVDEFPKPFSEAFEARYQLAEMASAQGDTAARRTWLKDMVQADRAAGSKRTERSRYVAATASLELAEPLLDAFERVKLNIPLEQSLALKKQRMEVALKALDKAAAYGVAEVTTAATFHIAQLYRGLSSDLLASQKPAGLSADELEQYDILLEEQAFPFEEKAIELYEVNAVRAADGVYDEWVKASFAQLAELMPARYAKTERSESYVVQLY